MAFLSARVLAPFMIVTAAAAASAQDVARVRALGQQERPALVTQILPLLPSVRVDVRREAANAVAQAFAAVPRTPDEPLPREVAVATRALLSRLRVEPDAVTKGIAAEALARVPHRAPSVLREVEEALRARLHDPHPAAVAGAAKGLDTLIRSMAPLGPEAATIDELRAAAVLGSDPSDGDLARVRRLAWLALAAGNGVNAALLEHGLDDPDLEVRRRAVLASPAVDMRPAQRRVLLLQALTDTAFQVRYEAVRAYARTLTAPDTSAAPPADRCAPLLQAADDANVHVSLAAIDALGTGCVDAPDKLKAVIDTTTAPHWRHRAAHAIVSLARVAPDEAMPRLALFADASDWQVRTYAARAAGVMMSAALLERLAADANDNVRYAAIEGLRQVRGHAADAIYIASLARRDYQLVMTAAQALEGSPDPKAVPALLAAFTRLTAERRDTSRDPRLALLVRLRELGSKAQAPALRGCLSDRDRRVAQECAATLQQWTGVAPTVRSVAAARAAVAPPPPTRVRLTMAGGGAIEVTLFTQEAPATTARFIQLAQRGYYNRLSFWRVAPGFVLQGGSPGANEYSGDGPFMRDELGLRANARGTIGLSTRGRHTGDAQFFVNLLDNPRLDHEFTVFGEITAGMDVADAVLEGDVIARIDVLGSPAATR
jgi:cyclophilin family peptidyl-prolyl cis-trans isomerase